MKSTYGDGLVVTRDLRERGIFALHLDGDLRNGSAVWSTVAGVAWLRLQCFPRGDEREVESNGGCGEASARYVVVVPTARQPTSGSDPVFFTPSGRVCCCSGITVMGTVWRWSSWCGVVYLLRLLLQRGHV